MKKEIIFLLFIFCNISCEKVDLNGKTILALGHGGMGISSIYPMNSLESISYCLNLDADGTEIDVQMTKDSVLVAFHDRELSHKTNVSGNIYNKNWSEISQARYIDPPYTRYQIINMDNLFSNLGDNINKVFALDCKDDYNPDTLYRNAFCNKLVEMIDKFNIKNNVIIEFKREDYIQKLKSLRPDLKIFIYSNFNRALAVANRNNIQGMVLSIDKISKEQVSIAHQNGLQVAVINTHSNKRNIEAIEKNIDIIETDNLKHLLRVLK